MRAEVLAIGDELITGQRLDTNTQWLSSELTACGVDVVFHTTIGDQLEENIAAFCLAIERADIVVSTGGLGPTADDLTREAIAAATGTSLVRDDRSLKHIQNLFASRGREMPERNAIQADFPQGASAISNAHGTAPGIEMVIERAGRIPCRLFALPGVPAELKPMWTETVRPAVLAVQEFPRITVHRRIKCFGAGESRVEELLPDMIARDRDPIVGITASNATITLRITTSGPDEAACAELIEPTVVEIRRVLGDLVFGEEEDELEHAVVRILTEQNLSLAVCEWATGGLVTQSIVAAGGSPLGIVVADWSAAQRALGGFLDKEVVPYGPDAATSLAEAVRSQAAADVGLGVASFPPDIQRADARLHVSIATADRTRELRFPCASHPAIVQTRAAKCALDAVRRTLLKLKPS